MNESAVIWESPCTGDSNASVTEIDDFSARGLRRVYGRGDHYPGRPAFNMDIWRDRTGRLLARFWSRSDEVDSESWDILGVRDADSLNGPPFDERWVPDCLRKQYGKWVIANF